MNLVTVDESSSSYAFNTSCALKDWIESSDWEENKERSTRLVASFSLSNSSSSRSGIEDSQDGSWRTSYAYARFTSSRSTLFSEQSRPSSLLI